MDAAVLTIQICLLTYSAAIDIATRTIPNGVSFALLLLGVFNRATNPSDVVPSLIAAAILFVFLVVCFARGWIGGGDVKLLAAVAVCVPLAGLGKLLTMTALAGVGLAVAHLALRALPDPPAPPADASLLRRIYAVERWRNRRRAPLPYGAAIAFGGVWTLLNLGY